MHNSKLIAYLSSLNKSELHRFEDFVNSPYFNKHENTRSLLRYILQAPSWDEHGLQKEKAFAFIFPGKPYEGQLLSNLISYLLKLFRQFLSQQRFIDQDNEQHLAQMEQASLIGQQKLFQLTANKWKRQHEEQGWRNSSFHFEQYRFQRLLNDFNLKNGSRFDGNFLGEADRHFTIYLIGAKLRLACEMLARSQVTGYQYNLPLIDTLVTFLEKHASQFQEQPSVWIYFLIYRMIKNDLSADYFELKNRLQQEAKFFPPDEGRDLYTYTLNYCIKRLNYGESIFRRETFELYQQMLDNKVLYREDLMPPWDYTNIVSLGLDLEEYEWTRQFIERQKPFLPAGERQNTFTYNLAVYQYQQQNYNEAIHLLNEVQFTEVYYNLLVRILRLKIYFEQGDQEALYYLLDTFRIYLLRNKQMTENRRRSTLNLLRFTKRLARIVEIGEIGSKRKFNAQLLALEEQIANHDRITSKAWLMEQIAAKKETSVH